MNASTAIRATFTSTQLPYAIPIRHTQEQIARQPVSNYLRSDVAKLNGLLRQCNGPCGRKLRYDPGDQRVVLTHRCSECRCDTQWTRIDL